MIQTYHLLDGSGLVEAHFLRYANDQYDKSFPLTKEELKELSIDYFKEYCSEVDHLNYNVWYLFHRCKQTEKVKVGENLYRNQETIPEEVKEIMKSFLDKDIDSFILSIIKIDHDLADQKVFAVSNVILEIFGSWQAFENELDQREGESNKYLQEFKAFLAEFASTNYSQYVHFDFKIIPIQDKLRTE